MNQVVYLVIRTGVYIRGIFGVYRDRGTAEQRLKEAKAREPDNYHDFEIVEAELDEPKYLETDAR